MIQKLILVYFIFINVAAFIVYTFDKYKSRVGAHRVSERELHTFSLIGGFLGASLAMGLFHHKVSKSSFLLKHIVIILLWIAGLLYYFLELNQLNFIR
ncbi:MAG: DUF1294 domain-containing protein [Campylobacterales bacterium]|nr:DUF1294 domain-containing protein [Campylobacterales bacterium]